MDLPQTYRAPRSACRPLTPAARLGGRLLVWGGGFALALAPLAAAQSPAVTVAGVSALHRPAPLRSQDAAGAVWPWLVGNIDAATPQIIADMAAAGLDTIYLHLWRTSGPGAGTLYMVDEAGRWNPAWGPTQPLVTLSTFIGRAHAAGLAVVGVVNCFLSPAPLPGDALHEQLLLNVIDYLVDSSDTNGRPIYALDGLALDRVRFYTGTTNPTQPVTAFVAAAKAQIGVLPLHAFLVASPFFIDGPPYDGSFHDYATAMSLLQGQFGQHWEALAPILDVLAPMAYVADGGVYGNDHALMAAYVATATEFARTAVLAAAAPATRVLPAVRNYTDSSGTTTTQSLSASLAGALVGGGQGFTSWRYFTSLGQPALWNIIALFTHPGPDLPLADLRVTSLGGNTVLLDASSSSSAQQPDATLLARFDLDGDGTADTPWSLDKQWTLLLPGPGPYPVGVQVRDGQRQLGARRRAMLSSSSSLTWDGSGPLSIARGGSLPLRLDLGPGAAGRPFVILPSLTAMAPAAAAKGAPSDGLTLSGRVTVPLRRDSLTDLVLGARDAGPFSRLTGILDSRGRARPTLELPPGLLPAALSGHSLRLAAVVLDPDGSPLTASTALAVALGR